MDEQQPTSPESDGAPKYGFEPADGSAEVSAPEAASELEQDTTHAEPVQTQGTTDAVAAPPYLSDEAPAEAGPAEPEIVVSGARFSRATGIAIALGATALTMWLLHEYADIIAPVFLAVNLLIAAFPVYNLLTRLKVPRPIASVATGLTVFLILVAGLAAILWSGTAMVNTLRGYSDQFTALYQDIVAWLGSLGFDEEALLEQLNSISPSNVIGVLRGLASNASNISGIMLVIVVALVFMVMDLPSLKHRMAITAELHPGFTGNVETFVKGIRSYWLVTTIFGLIVAALDGVALVALGVSLPVVWAVLSFITNYIPNIGFVIGLVPPALLALVEQGPGTALAVVLIYSVMNFVLQSIVQPKFTGDAVGITPTISFLSLLLWAAVFGPLGALIALPFTLMIKSMLIDNDPKVRWISALISSNPEAAKDTT